MPGSANPAKLRIEEWANYVLRSLISAMEDGRVVLGIGEGEGCSTNLLSDTDKSTCFTQKHQFRKEKMKSHPCSQFAEWGCGKS